MKAVMLFMFILGIVSRGDLAQGDDIERGECRCSSSSTCASFDQMQSKFQGTCTYLMTRDKCRGGFPYTEDSETTFAVYADVHPGDDSSLERDVIVVVHGHTFRLNVGRKSAVDGHAIGAVDLPYHLMDNDGAILQVANGDEYMELTTGLLVVKTDDLGAFTISVTQNHQTHGMLCGMCGDFDENPYNDMVIGPFTPCDNDDATQGTMTSDVEEFGNSWNAIVTLGEDNDQNCHPTDCLVPPPYVQNINNGVK